MQGAPQRPSPCRHAGGRRLAAASPAARALCARGPSPAAAPQAAGLLLQACSRRHVRCDRRWLLLLVGLRGGCDAPRLQRRDEPVALGEVALHHQLGEAGGREEKLDGRPVGARHHAACRAARRESRDAVDHADLHGRWDGGSRRRRVREAQLGRAEFQVECSAGMRDRVVTVKRRRRQHLAHHLVLVRLGLHRLHLLVAACRNRRRRRRGAKAARCSSTIQRHGA
mmetsp:Transcript_22849/g.73109  ORF Transcript_22849/g.73109 Transcript_22849/m.73109 type:complete len:226 (+) Transcript_22849:233-910(+)